MIVAEHLTKHFEVVKKDKGLKGAFKALFSRKKEIIRAVEDVSFEIAAGEMVGYIGANGAGKSTTIKMMTGILTPSSGHCLVNGIVPHDNRIENAMHIGVVFGQRTQLWWDLPLHETFAILKEIYDVDNQDFEERFAFLNGILDLNDFIKMPVRALSLGQRMRADLAASLLHQPKVLFLDEPTIGLDVMVKHKIRNAIREINDRFKTTLILTTHDLNDIEELCKRIMIIDKGRLLYDGSIKAIKDKFGYLRTIRIEAKDPAEMEKLDVKKMFRMGGEDMQTWVEDGRFYLSFNKNKVTAGEILGGIMKKASVLDMSIQDVEIEDIVKQIYSREVEL